MAEVGLKLIEPNVLYNMLQQGTYCSRLSDPNYLLLIDARSKKDYNESHVMTAKKAPKTEQGLFWAPYDAELECKQNVVIYDGATDSLSIADAPAVICARMLWNLGSRNPVMILRGGYVLFSALYPFLRTIKTIYMPRELDAIVPYPVEIQEGFLYLGTRKQAVAEYIQKDLKIQAHINLCEEKVPVFKEEEKDKVLHIKVQDINESLLYESFEETYTFIEERKKESAPVLVFSDLGISRSATIIIAYLMKSKKWPLELAYQQVGNCQTALRPNRGFIEQLSLWEETLFGSKSTNITDPNF